MAIKKLRTKRPQPVVNLVYARLVKGNATKHSRNYAASTILPTNLGRHPLLIKLRTTSRCYPIERSKLSWLYIKSQK